MPNPAADILADLARHDREAEERLDEQVSGGRSRTMSTEDDDNKRRDEYRRRVQAEAVSRGLRHCRIVPLPGADLGAVSPNCTTAARWNGFELYHSGRGYWVLHGRVPLAVAEELYGDPAGRDLIRVAGHCMRPPPAEWAHYFLPDGREVVNRIDSDGRNQEAMLNDLIQREIVPAASREKAVFTEDRTRHPEARAYIITYHIDSDLGLRLMVDTLRRHGLYEPDPPAATPAAEVAAHEERERPAGTGR